LKEGLEVLDLTHEARVVLDEALLLSLLPDEVLVLGTFDLRSQVLNLPLELTLDISSFLSLKKQILL